MTLHDAPSPTRRALRERADEPMDAVGGIVATEAVLTLDPGPQPEVPKRPPAPVDPRRRVALTWVDEASIGRSPGPVADLSTATTPFIPVGADLLVNAPRRSPLRPGVVVPTLLMAGLVGAYSATTLLWPLNAVTPTITPMEVQPVCRAGRDACMAGGRKCRGVGGRHPGRRPSPRRMPVRWRASPRS